MMRHALQRTAVLLFLATSLQAADDQLPPASNEPIPLSDSGAAADLISRPGPRLMDDSPLDRNDGSSTPMPSVLPSTRPVQVQLPLTPALTQPVEPAPVAGTPWMTKIGIVDMDKVFNELADAYQVRQELGQEVDRWKAKITDAEQEVNVLKQGIAQLTGSGQARQVNTTDLAGNPHLDPTERIDPARNPTVTQDQIRLIEAKRRDLSYKEQELRRIRRQAIREISGLEEQKSTALLRKIQPILEKLAREEGIDLIVDRKSVLFGNPKIDLTAKLIGIALKGKRN